MSDEGKMLEKSVDCESSSLRLCILLFYDVLLTMQIKL